MLNERNTYSHSATSHEILKVVKRLRRDAGEYSTRCQKMWTFMRSGCRQAADRGEFLERHPWCELRGHYD